MLKACTRQVKGNDGMFYDRSPRICAAGVPSAAETSVAACLSQYSLQDEVDALIHDAIIPEPKPRPTGRVVLKIPVDMRNAGPFTECAQLINPPVKSKFQTLVDDFKDTVYTSYWKKQVGTVPDPVPKLPEGCDIYVTTFGRKYPQEGRLYDIALMPINPVPDVTLAAKEPGHQTSRNYCESFNTNQIFGKPEKVDRSGKWMKCCLTDNSLKLNTINGPMSSRLADFRSANMPQLGVHLAPNDNISCVPPGFTFGKKDEESSSHVPDCLTTCEINPEREFFQKCLAHLNTIRKCLKKRFEGNFFNSLYLKIKYADKNNIGWLPKDVVYEFCYRRYIRFDSFLLEPLLATWNAFDGSRVNYKIFVDILNHTVPFPDLPKVWDVPDDCTDYRTTYTEMVKPGQESNRLMAGIPSGRYFDLDYPQTPKKCCKAHKAFLPEESDARICLNPSIFTLFGVSHRDMYTKRTPEVIRKVFEGSGETFTDETFNAVWNEAKKYHSREWVCYETFKRALSNIKKE